MSGSAFAPGKIILSGEYAVAFGYPGIAVPSALGIETAFEEQNADRLTIESSDKLKHPKWFAYIERMLSEIKNIGEVPNGTLRISGALPAGRGMGSSTALLIAIARTFDIDNKENIRAIENLLTPGNSGIDFEVIWNEKPILYKEGTFEVLEKEFSFLKHAVLIDTGMPDQTTAELVKEIQEKREALEKHLKEIGQCTNDLLERKDPYDVMRRHHRAQMALGVVPEHVQKLIAGIEQMGGAAKVTGAGSRTGGGGMVLAIHENIKTLSDLAALDYPVLPL